MKNLLPIAAVMAAGFASAASAEVPIHFKLDHPGYVTLVVDDAQGHRVKNLIGEKHFDAGDQTVNWDGRDETGGVKQVDGIYQTTGQPVVPGDYHVHGLVHDAIGLKYEFSVYTAGNPPWRTTDKTGRWLADHTPPIDALFLPTAGPDSKPEMLLAAYVAEGGDALVWTDPTGKRLDGVRWVGGNWTGALAIARDDGSHPIKENDAYVVSSWLVPADPTLGKKGGPDQKMNGEIRLTSLAGDKSDKIWVHTFDPAPFADQLPKIGQLRAWEKRFVGGLAVYDGVVVINLMRHGELRFIDARAGKQIGSVKLADARGLAFDSKGKLLALVGNQLHQYAVSVMGDNVMLASDRVLVSTGLQNPDRVTVDPASHEIYISDWGSNTVKVFTAEGQPVRTIGEPGGTDVGKYDPTHMQNPSGMAIAPDGTLWVAEENYSPKRVSIWSKDGTFERALYGPPQYGGGGNLSSDKKTFYYYDYRGMAFDIDWPTGKWFLRNIYFDPAKDMVGLFQSAHVGRRTPVGIVGGPQMPIDFKGHRYLTNVFENETEEVALAALWREDGDVIHPVAVVGDASQWPLMYEDRFRDRLPPGTDLTSYEPGRSPIFVAWSDRNGDGQVQPDEVTSKLLDSFGSNTTGKYRIDHLFIGADLSVSTTFTYQLATSGFTDKGVPLYDAASIRPMFTKPQNLNLAQNHDVITADDGFLVQTGSPIRGFKDGEVKWTYPDAWPDLHEGHKAPPRQYTGQLIATTKIIGEPVIPPKSDAGAIWALNGDRGDVYLMTMDGLFVSQLFQIPTTDVPKPKQWGDLPAQRGLDISDISVPGENFMPTINQTTDGEVYLVTGKEHVSLVHVTGLDTIRRLPESTITVSGQPPVAMGTVATGSDNLPAAQKNELQVLHLPDNAVVDGKLNEWAKADWVDLDKNARAAVGITGDRLLMAYHTNDPDLLNNKPEALSTMFKAGGALDLMLQTDPTAKPVRDGLAVGEVRLLISEVDGKPVAVLYCPVVVGEKRPVSFSSPARTVTFDRVDDVSKSVSVAHVGGDYECSISLAALGMKPPAAGSKLRGDIGVLRGQPGNTTQRLYWHNKDTGIVEDVPSEAMLEPRQWGTFVFNP